MGKSSKPVCKKGDRALYLGKIWGTVTNIFQGVCPYEITTDTGKAERYSKGELNRWFQLFPPEPELADIEEEELSLFDLTPDVGAPDPETLPENPITTIFSREKCSNSETSVQVSVLDSPSPASSLEDLPLLAYVSRINGVQKSLDGDFQGCQSIQMSGTTKESEVVMMLQPSVHPANPSPSKANDLDQATKEIAFQLSSKSLPESSPNSLRSKTSEDCLPVPGDQDTEKEHISTIFSVTFPSGGTMRNGKWSAQECLQAPSLESGYCWLASPGAMSSFGKGRPPGTDKLTDDLQKKQLISSTEVADPEFLEKSFNIPSAWTSPSELRAGTELLADAEKRLETASIPELQLLHLKESSISIRSLLSRHFWCDLHTVAVTVVDEHLIEIEGQSYYSAKGVEVEPWWEKNHTLGKRAWIRREELEEIEEFSCPLPERALNDSLEKSHPSQWKTGDRFVANSDDAIPFQVMEVKPSKIKIKFDNGNTNWYKIEWLIPWCNRQTYLGNVSNGRSPSAHFSLEKSAQSPVNPLTGISPNSHHLIIGSSPNPYQGKQTGSLYQYTANKADKLGTIHTYPKVEGDRKREEDSHWYWGFSYVEKELGKWRDKSAAIPRKKLAAVRQALRDSKPYTFILQEILGK